MQYQRISEADAFCLPAVLVSSSIEHYNTRQNGQINFVNGINKFTPYPCLIRKCLRRVFSFGLVYKVQSLIKINLSIDPSTHRRFVKAVFAHGD